MKRARGRWGVSNRLPGRGEIEASEGMNGEGEAGVRVCRGWRSGVRI